MKAAIVHYWLLNQRGGEAVLEALCRLLPEADIFTLFYDPARVSPFLRSRRVIVSGLNPLRRFYRSLLPFMPLALEQFDLRGYDLVVSSESGPAKGVLASSSALHVCYCHTPMRYLWDLYPDYYREWTPAWKRPLMAAMSSYLRTWDFAAAARVDRFVANSRNVQKRVWRAFRRDSEVVYPPVAVDTFHWREPEDYYLMVGELVPYKRFDVAVRCCARSGRRLRIVGAGPEYRRLRALAGPRVEFCGRVGNGDLRELYARCRALILPGEEDFGITAVEALASGKPVLALAKGGALETVPAAYWYEDTSESGLESALRRFENGPDPYRAEDLQRFAARFAPPEFDRKMRGILQLPETVTTHPFPGTLLERSARES